MNAPPDLSHSVSITALGTAGIAMVTLVVLGIAILTSLFDRRYSAQTLELESAEQRYRLLFERSFLAGIIRTKLDGLILDCNQACAQILGYSSREELMASPVAEHYFDPEDRNTFIAKLKKEKSLSNYEHRLRARARARARARMKRRKPRLASGKRSPSGRQGWRACRKRRNFY